MPCAVLAEFLLTCDPGKKAVPVVLLAQLMVMLKLPRPTLASTCEATYCTPSQDVMVCLFAAVERLGSSIAGKAAEACCADQVSHGMRSVADTHQQEAASGIFTQYSFIQDQVVLVVIAAGSPA